QGHRPADGPGRGDGGAAGRSWRAAPAGRSEEAERQAGGAPDCAGLHEPAPGPRALDASAAGRAHGGGGPARLALVRDGAADAKKNSVKPWQKKQWCVAKVGADFVWRVESVLDLYAEPYDPRRPVVSFDEKPYPLRAHKHEPLPARPGQ